MKKHIFNFLKIAVTILLLYFLFRKMDFKTILTTLRHINIFVYLIGALLFFTGIFLSSIRWKLFLDTLGIEFSLSQLFTYFLYSLFLANFLPSGGLDVARVAFLGKQKLKEKISSTFMDRLFGFLAINIYVFLGLIYGLKEASKYRTLIFGVLVFQLIFLFVIFSRRLKKYAVFIKKLPFGEKFYNLYEILHSFRDIKVVMFALGLSFVIQFLYSADAYIVMRSLHLCPPFTTSILFVPLINFISMIPVTISGFGVREGGFVFVFSSFIGKEGAMTASLLYYFTTFIVSLTGGIFLLFYRRK